LVLGLTDLSIHTSTDATVDVDATYNKNYQEILGIAPLEGNHFMGTFGHMMGGYDAGYYGYIWSEVYAQDMWSLFKGNPLNEEMGMKYRKTILEQGSMRPALDLIEELLGRPLSFDAFYEKLGIK
jgi:Zn-dependent oligopeptidase